MRVGIDLGTTYSLVAKTELDGRVILLPDNSDQDIFHTPSVVHLSGHLRWSAPWRRRCWNRTRS